MSEPTREPIQLRTHTSLWRVEKRLYTLYDWTLPMPVSVKQLAIVFGVGVPWIFIMRILGVPFSPPVGYILWLGPPAAAAYWANKPVIEGKSLVELIVSQVRYLFQPRTWAGMRPFKPDVTHDVTVDVWRRHNQPDLAAVTPEIQSLAT
jgi:hypothetical protein